MRHETLRYETILTPLNYITIIDWRNAKALDGLVKKYYVSSESAKSIVSESYNSNIIRRNIIPLEHEYFNETQRHSACWANTHRPIEIFHTINTTLSPTSSMMAIALYNVDNNKQGGNLENLQQDQPGQYWGYGPKFPVTLDLWTKTKGSDTRNESKAI